MRMCVMSQYVVRHSVECSQLSSVVTKPLITAQTQSGGGGWGGTGAGICPRPAEKDVEDTGKKEEGPITEGFGQYSIEEKQIWHQFL